MVVSSRPLSQDPAPPFNSMGHRPMGPSCDLRTRGLSSFPPRLAREVCLPPIRPRISSISQAPSITLEMRPARPPVSGLWHRLRFSRFSPLASQRRSTWKPGNPNRGKPEGTKGAGSRSL